MTAIKAAQKRQRSSARGTKQLMPMLLLIISKRLLLHRAAFEERPKENAGLIITRVDSSAGMCVAAPGNVRA